MTSNMTSEASPVVQDQVTFFGIVVVIVACDIRVWHDHAIQVGNLLKVRLMRSNGKAGVGYSHMAS